MLFGFSKKVKAQATEQAFVPIILDVSQILRMNIASGGTIEFAFNSIEDYRSGISGAVAGNNFYITQFNISSSTPWILNYGSEINILQGVDNPINTLPANIIGFELQTTGNYTLGAEINSFITNNGADIIGLDLFPTVLMEPAAGPLPRNAGNINDNSFLLVWRCGTSEGTMLASNLLELNTSPASDRYITNVFFELIAAP